MKYKLTVKEHTYEVDIEKINARPVVAWVDGQRFEIMPERRSQIQVKEEAGSKVASKPAGTSPLPAANPLGGGNSLTAPLPGTVVEMFVKPGEKVESGQVVLIIEAMKMKNSIRSTRGGTVGKVLANVGQSVAHKQALIEFAEE